MAWRTYQRPLAKVPLRLALALVVEDLLAPARMWGDAEAEAKAWANLAREHPAITPDTGIGKVPDWWYDPVPTSTIEVP